MPPMETLVTIGTIIKPYGVKGEVIVKNESRWYEPFKGIKEISAFKGPHIIGLRIEFTQAQKDGLRIKFKEIDNPETGATFSGAELKIPASQLPELPKDQFYAFELKGFEVFDMNDRKVGIITDAVNFPANDVIMIEDSDGKEWLIPALKSTIKGIDRRSRKIIIDTATAMSE